MSITDPWLTTLTTHMFAACWPCSRARIQKERFVNLDDYEKVGMRGMEGVGEGGGEGWKRVKAQGIAGQQWAAEI